ncbi:hypothetical protein ACHQM5_009096 [Ranunculus cassubicifolius]
MWSIPKIRYVFTMRVARNLLLLEVLEIVCCSSMEVLFKYEDGEDIKCDQEFKDTAILPRLKDVSLIRADKLQSFTNNQNLIMELPSVEYLEVFECGILERLPFGTTSVPNLKYFEMDDTEHFERLEWDDDTVMERLQAILDVDAVYDSDEEEDESVAEEDSNTEGEDESVKSRLEDSILEIFSPVDRSGMELEARTVDEDGQSKTDNRIIVEEDENKSSNKGKGLKKKWKRIQRPTTTVAASKTSAPEEYDSVAEEDYISDEEEYESVKLRLEAILAAKERSEQRTEMYQAN